MVAEGVVLRRVEHLEQRARRVAAPVGADLVDLVEHHHRVLRAGVLQRADDPARAARRRTCAGGRGSRPRRGSPPSETRTNFRPSARATDSPSDVLPTPGGPTSVRIAPEPRPVASREPALLRGACGRPGTRGSGPSRPRDPRDRRRARGAPRRCRGCPRCGRSTGPRSSSRGTCGSTRTRATARRSAPAGRARARPARDVVGHPGLRRSSCGAPRRRPPRRPRRAPCGSPPSARAGSTRAGASRGSPTPRRGSAPSPRPRRACPSPRRAPSPGAPRRRSSRGPRPSARSDRSGE